MKRNLRKLYGAKPGNGNRSHIQRNRRRALHLRKTLSSHGIIRWAETSELKSFQTLRDDDFEKRVWEIERNHNNQSTWSNEVIELLERLSETEFSDSEDLKALYQGML